MAVLKNTNTDISKEIFISPNQVDWEDYQASLEDDYAENLYCYQATDEGDDNDQF